MRKEYKLLLLALGFIVVGILSKILIIVGIALLLYALYIIYTEDKDAGRDKPKASGQPKQNNNTK